uniref:F-box domain-containing protein n=1 Tax=Tanacetum cinerariifolium TaxID=118510 RepID=A0A6L2KU54_TANCI|nr:hypothetical protein [Tanacetum cinerariifolium]
MPPDVISNILDRLPTQDAVKTDILAKSWRFIWTMITQLIFDYDFFQFVLGPEGDNEFNGRSLTRLLIYLKGPITKFVLNIDQEMLDAEDIIHWISFVSRNGIKDLTLENPSRDELYIYQSYTFGEFITMSPLLEILKYRDFVTTKEVKLVEIAKLRNLKTLSLDWFALEHQMIIKSSSIFQLKGLPKLQELGLNFLCCGLPADGVKKKVPSAFPSPNLQTLEIKACYNYDSPETLWSLKLDPKTAGPLQLLDVAFPSFRGSKNEVCLLRYILACSPLLKMSITLELESLVGGEALLSM